MKQHEIDDLVVLIETLQLKITETLDENCENIDGELRTKMSIAESNLFKLSSILKRNKDVCNRRI